MKKILFIVVVLCILTKVSFSQTEQGNIMLGGSGSTGLHFDDGYDYFHLDLYPDLGYFVATDVAVGARVPIYFSFHENRNYYSFGLTPFMRYFPMHTDNVGYFVGMDIGFRGSTYSDYDDTDWDYTIGLETGAAIFLNESIGLEVKLYYNYYNQEEYFGTGRLDYSSLTVNVGFQVYFGR